MKNRKEAKGRDMKKDVNRRGLVTNKALTGWHLWPIRPDIMRTGIYLVRTETKEIFTLELRWLEKALGNGSLLMISHEGSSVEFKFPEQVKELIGCGKITMLYGPINLPSGVEHEEHIQDRKIG